MSKRHRAGRNVRGGVALGAVLTAAALTTGAAYASASASPATMLSCADAITAYNTAQQDAIAPDGPGSRTDGTVITPAEQAAIDKATDDAKLVSSAGGAIITDTEQAAIDKMKAAAVSADSPGTEVHDGRVITPEEQAGINNAKAAADTACQGPAGPVGPAGVAGAVGPKGIDARIVLSPLVCARAVVTPDARKLVRVVTLIPCPVTVPAPPTVEPKPGDEVVVIPSAAPVPPVQETHLPVTH